MPKPYADAEIPLALALAMARMPEQDIAEAIAEHRAQVLREGAAKLLEMAKTSPGSPRAGGLAFSAGVLDQMAEPDPDPAAMPGV